MAESSFFSTLASYVLPTVHAEEPKEPKEEDVVVGDVPEEQPEDEEVQAEEAEAEEEDEDEEEPEDQAPPIREACEQNECKESAKHFQHCSEKVEAGKGWEGEDCVEELFHMMHCVDACAAPKLFKKLA